jgi:hypothetical protein
MICSSEWCVWSAPPVNSLNADGVTEYEVVRLARRRCCRSERRISKIRKVQIRKVQPTIRMKGGYRSFDSRLFKPRP